jgi:hypothetical protein
MWVWPNWDNPWRWWGLLRERHFDFEDEDEEEQDALTDLMDTVGRRRAAAAL